MSLSSQKIYVFFFKSTFDKICALIGLLLLSPVLLLIAAAVKLDSSGTVFFCHERVGLHGRSFRLYKFRSMAQNTGLPGASVTMKGDPRITRTGRFLRKYKLDELPQLLNVILGDISLVGPRPEVRKYVQLFWKDYQHILSIKPGITDYAALEFRDEEAILAKYADNMEQGYVTEILPKKIELYKEYLENISLIEDLRIIFRTLWKVISPG